MKTKKRRETMMRNCKDGEYYYAPYRRRWGMWQWHDDGNGMGYGEFVMDFDSRDAAVLEVYKRNGWKLKTK